MLDAYSCLPNSRAGPNKRAGWNFIEKKLSEQGLISEQGGIYDEIDNRAGQVSPLYQYKELQTFSIYIVDIVRYIEFQVILPIERKKIQFRSTFGCWISKQGGKNLENN